MTLYLEILVSIYVFANSIFIGYLLVRHENKRKQDDRMRNKYESKLDFELSIIRQEILEQNEKEAIKLEKLKKKELAKLKRRKLK